jgi:hypothetical protein
LINITILSFQSREGDLSKETIAIEEEMIVGIKAIKVKEGAIQIQSIVLIRGIVLIRDTAHLQGATPIATNL